MPLIFMVLFISLNLSFLIFEVVIGSPKRQACCGDSGEYCMQNDCNTELPEYMFLSVIFSDSDD